MIYKLLDTLLTIFFPKICAGCKKEDDYLCATCIKKITPRPEIENKNELLIHSCFRYHDGGVLAKLLHLWKYNFITDSESTLRKLLKHSLPPKDFFKNALLCPLPLDKKRLRWRGFHQTEHLAIILQQIVKQKWNFTVPVMSLLKKVHDTKPQADLSRELRLQNVIDSFIPNEIQFQSKKIILIDDVMTTGTTLRECQKVLKGKFPATEVQAFVIAKAEMLS
jgi:competence protein ComFC